MRKKYLSYGLLLLGTVSVIGCANPADQENAATEETSQVSTSTGSDSTDSIGTASEWEAQYTTQVNQTLLDAHEERDQEMMEEFQNGNFTIEEPLVFQDPYGRAPLTALVMFETEEPMEITVTVDGKTEDAAISHTYSGLETEHRIPVLGLYPEMENQVTITGETGSGEMTETSLTMETGSLPEDMLDFTLEASQPEKMEEGLTFVSPSRAYPAGLDHNGDVRWYTSVVSSNQFKRLENGNVLMTTEEDPDEHTDEYYDHLTEMDMLGKVHQSIKIEMEHMYSSSPLHHDTIILPNDNYLALLHDGSEEYVEDEMAELDRETGEVVNRINFKDIFPASMYEDYSGHGSDVGDWLHINTVWKLEDEDALLLSLRQQDTILKMSYPEGEIEWLFGYPEDWPEELEQYLLEPVDEEVKFPTGPHAPMELPDQDGNEDTLDILLFDNNRIINRGDESVDEEYSRAVQYRIDEEEGTVEEIWSYGEERGTDFHSGIVGDADYLPEANNVLITSGRIIDDEVDNQSSSLMVEVTRTEDPEVVYELRYGPFVTDEYTQIYRAERMPLYPEN